MSRVEIQAIFDAVDHRPWPMSTRPWLMTQVWQNLLFMHWRVEAETLRRLVPAPLELDLFEGGAYLGVVPFWIPDESLRGRIKVPLAGSFIELNVRTYVTWRGQSGVYFISLDASNHVAVLAARFLYTLPYFHAKMSFDRDDDNWIHYRSTRRHGGAPLAEFKGRYRPSGPALPLVPGSLEHWLTERYALFTVDDGHVFRGDIHHPPWRLHPAEAVVELNTMASCWDVTLPDTAPHLHYSEHQATVIWPLTVADP